jgi:hypothetical protein
MIARADQVSVDFQDVRRPVAPLLPVHSPETSARPAGSSTITLPASRAFDKIVMAACGPLQAPRPTAPTAAYWATATVNVLGQYSMTVLAPRCARQHPTAGPCKVPRAWGRAFLSAGNTVPVAGLPAPSGAGFAPLVITRGARTFPNMPLASYRGFSWSRTRTNRPSSDAARQGVPLGYIAPQSRLSRARASSREWAPEPPHASRLPM